MNEFGKGLDYAGMVMDILQLKEHYPFLEVGSIGRSVEDRDIPVLRIGCGTRHIHFNGAFHANEWITTSLLIRFIREYAEAYTHGNSVQGVDAKQMFEQTSLWVVPMVNPDGVELVLTKPEDQQRHELLEWNGGSTDFSGWKANIHGVDLNDQFPANWELERTRRQVANPASRDYSGSSPLSEPEARAIEAFTRERDFAMVIAFHTQGEEIYWNYNDYEPVESEAIAERFAQVSGYRAVKLTGSDAGYKDWFIQEFRRPGFTVETGLGINPLPYSQLDDMYGKASKIMVEALKL
ncbi:M14 family metallocarboxypeptidase [Paenibacillus sp. WQ 127069]|uniref:M14 family metallocarboxypeptidase n=1 Tax=Paenibacillus baimaensis TaxID=2982185 RepID=A0ABT2UJ52_9BACL|nr:M14 family metallocarboxypeptidase [Paenibacillus sp. WQ 127069]MCU6794672.1 M14 family metallocarboxypeptidase [Paenibacillus sp. WQ 127069]